MHVVDELPRSPGACGTFTAPAAPQQRRTKGEVGAPPLRQPAGAAPAQPVIGWCNRSVISYVAAKVQAAAAARRESGRTGESDALLSKRTASEAKAHAVSVAACKVR